MVTDTAAKQKSPTKAQLQKQVASLQKQLADLKMQREQPKNEVELALRERVKELNCLYTIARLQEEHFPSIDRFLQGVVDILPGSFLLPEQACARIRCGEDVYLSSDFEESDWAVVSDIRVNGEYAGMVEVFYRNPEVTDEQGPFLPEEYTLINAVAERITNVLMHMQSESRIREAHEALQCEHRALQETNIALRTVMNRLEEEKREIRVGILNNIQKIVMPIVYELELHVSGQQRSYVTLLRKNLQQIAEPFLSEISQDHLELTPVEIVISTMIRNGLSTKEIARLRCISPATVRRHRENIRRKLGLRNRKVNLTTYLQSISQRNQKGDDPNDELTGPKGRFETTST